MTDYKIGTSRNYVGKAVAVINHHAMKTYGEVEIQLHVSLTLALDGDEWLVSLPGRVFPKERTAVLTGHWVR
jgi:hypothetical protein